MTKRQIAALPEDPFDIPLYTTKKVKVKKPPLEKEIEKKICDYAKSKGCYVRKFTSPNNRSVPDRLIIAPGGAVGFLEVKRGGEKPTKAQEHEMDLLKKQGCNVTWCDNVETGKVLIDGLLIVSDRMRPGHKFGWTLPTDTINDKDFWG